MDDVWVIVPTFNEAATVGSVIADLRRSFPHVLCVDDGSTDGSAGIARAAGAQVVSHAVNLGQGAALQTGFEYIRDCPQAEYCVTFDADGQHVVDDAVHMVEVLRETGRDVALASRFSGSTSHMPRARGVVLRAGVWFTRATTRLQVTDTHNGLRVLRRRVLDKIELRMNGMAYASEFLGAIIPNDLSYVEVPVQVLYTEYSRGKGQHNINALNILFDLALARLRPL